MSLTHRMRSPPAIWFRNHRSLSRGGPTSPVPIVSGSLNCGTWQANRNLLQPQTLLLTSRSIIPNSSDTTPALSRHLAVLVALPFRLMQSWGPDRARQSTLISEYATAQSAYEEIDRLAALMERTGAPSDEIELVVVNPSDEIVQRRDLH